MAVDDVMQTAKVCLAPLRFGAGIKGKLISAMQNGTPSVTTNIGAEGMLWDLHWSGNIANDSVNLANAAITLYKNKTDWKKAQKQGFEIISAYYSKSKLKVKLLSKIEVLCNNLLHHRTQNFIGALLQYQSMMSTKYMGKWIEEKNKKT